jgi:hypothetical protein
MRTPLRTDSGRMVGSAIRPHSTVEARIKIRIAELKILAHAAAYDARFPSPELGGCGKAPLER